MSLSVIRNCLPKHSKHYEISVLAMDARPAQLNHLIANRLKNDEFKFLRAIITQMGCSVPAGLQTVSAHHLTSWQMLDDEMVAYSVKGIFIKPGRMGFLESFPQFEVKHFITQGLGGPDLTEIAREARC